MDKYNTKLSQLGGLFTQTASEIMNDPDLKTGEKFLLLQRLVADIKPATEAYGTLDKQIKDYAKENLQDGQTVNYEGAEVTIKYSAPPKPSLDPNKILLDLEKAYADLNQEVNKSLYLVYGNPSKRVIIQSILTK
jgi:hypothetical protein